MSPAFKLDFQDFKSIIKSMIFYYSPVLLLFTNQIQAWTFDYKILGWLVLSTSIHWIQKYLTDNTK